MANDDEISVCEAIAAIQRAAYEAVGISCAELTDRFRLRRKQARDFDKARPNYLPVIADLREEDKSLGYLARSFEDRAMTPTPTPFEDPLAYSWLADTWRYHASRLYSQGDELAGKRITLATAPTGRLNAIAVSAFDGFGIVLESGLWQMARRLCIEVDPLLYRTEGATGFRREMDDVRAQCDEHPDVIKRIADICISYVVDGVTPRLTPTDQDFGAPARMYESLFGGFIGFTIEHELHHLVEHLQNRNASEANEPFASVWKFLQTSVWPELKTPPSEQWVRAAFNRLHEEMRADVRGLNRLVLLGLKEGTASPTIAGGLLFFHVADAIRTVYLMLEDLDLLKVQADMTQDGLFLAALLSGESHPYPAVRGHAAVAASQSIAPVNGTLVRIENDRVAVVFERVQAHLRSYPPGVATKQHAHPKWTSNLRSLIGL